MEDINQKIGINAGKIWVALNKYGPQTQSNILKKSRLSLMDFYIGVGWLARENKICKDGTTYRLGETNLTEKIGGNAGKVWRTLETRGEVDISSIAEISQIKTQDAYSALGWLAREDKVKGEKNKDNSSQVRFKLR